MRIRTHPNLEERLLQVEGKPANPEPKEGEPRGQREALGSETSNRRDFQGSRLHGRRVQLLMPLADQHYDGGEEDDDNVEDL